MKIGYFKVIGNMMDKTIEQKQELLEKISSNKHFKINYEN